MSIIKRAFSSFPVLSSSPPSNSIPMRRQEAPGKYLTSAKLQEFLENKFPNHPRRNFHIQIHEDVLSFDAPSEVTEAELQKIRQEVMKEILAAKRKQKDGKGLEHQGDDPKCDLRT